MRCKNCGAPLKDGAKFCTKCGAPVEKKSFPRVLPVILLALVIAFGGGFAAIRTLGSIKAGVSGYDAASGKDKSENKKQRTNKAETEEKAAVKKAAAEKAEKTAETSAVETPAAETQAMLTRAAGTKAAEWPTGEPLTLPAVMPDNSYSAVPETSHAVMNGTAAQLSQDSSVHQRGKDHDDPAGRFRHLAGQRAGRVLPGGVSGEYRVCPGPVSPGCEMTGCKAGELPENAVLKTWNKTAGG